MKKDQISIALKTLEQTSQRHKLLKNIEKHNWEESEEKLNIFWVLSWKQKENIRILLTNTNPEKKLNPEVLRESKKIASKIIRIISSLSSDGFNIWNTNIEKKINQIMKTWGNALEFFILWALIENKTDKDNIFEKWPIEFDWNKIDFLHKKWNLKFWIQLTTTESKNIWRKKEDMHNLQFAIDNDWNFPTTKKSFLPEKDWSLKNKTPRNKLNKKNYSPYYLPDISVLLVINSEISREINSDNNLLYDTYIKWKTNKFDSRNPNKYLPENIKNELDFISKTYFIVIEKFLELVKNNDKIFKKMKNFKFSLWELWETIVSIIPETKTINFICFPYWKSSNEAIYNLEFYLTEKFIKKIRQKENKD